MSARIELDLDIFPGSAPTECVLALTWIAGCKADAANYEKILRPWNHRNAFAFGLYRWRNGSVDPVTSVGPIEDDLFEKPDEVEALRKLLEAAYHRSAPDGFVRSLDFRSQEAETIDGVNYLFWPEVMAELARLPGLWPQQAGLEWLFDVSDHQAGDRYLLVPTIDGVGFTAPGKPTIEEALKEALTQNKDRVELEVVSQALELTAAISPAERPKGDSVLDFSTQFVHARGAAASRNWLEGFELALANALDPTDILAGVAGVDPALVAAKVRAVYGDDRDASGAWRCDTDGDDHVGALLDIVSDALPLVKKIRALAPGANTSDDYAEVLKQGPEEPVRAPQSIDDWVALTQPKAVILLACLRWKRGLDAAGAQELEALKLRLLAKEPVSGAIGQAQRRSWFRAQVWPEFQKQLTATPATEDARIRYANALLALAPALALQIGANSSAVVARVEDFLREHCDLKKEGGQWQIPAQSKRSDRLAIMVDQPEPAPNQQALPEDWLGSLAGLALLVQQGDPTSPWYCPHLVRATLSHDTKAPPILTEISTDTLAALPIGYAGGQRQCLLEYAGRSLIAADSDVLADMQKDGADQDMLDALGLRLRLSAVLQGGKPALLPDLKDGQTYTLCAAMIGKGNVLPPPLRGAGNPAAFDMVTWAIGEPAFQPAPEWLHQKQLLRRVPLRAPDLLAVNGQRSLHDAAATGVVPYAPELLKRKASADAKLPLVLLCPPQGFLGASTVGLAVGAPSTEREVWERHWSWDSYLATGAAKQAIEDRIVSGLDAYVEALSTSDEGVGVRTGFDDPACQALWFQLFDLNGTLLRDESISLNQAKDGGLKEWRTVELKLECVSDSTPTLSITPSADLVHLKLPPGQAYKLVVCGLVPESMFTGPHARFAPNLVKQVAGLNARAFEPACLLIETATDALPTLDPKDLSYELASDSLLVRLRPTNPAYRVVRDVSTLVQRWAWRGRTLFEATEQLAADLAGTAPGPFIPANWSQWTGGIEAALTRFESSAFAGRSELDGEVQSSVLAADTDVLDIAALPLGVDPVASYIRVQIKLESRYRRLMRSPKDVVFPLQGNRPGAKWAPILVRQRRQALPAPIIDSLLPLTKWIDQQPAFLVEFGEAWHREGGFAETLQIEIAGTRHYVDPQNSQPIQEVGYVPTRTAQVLITDPAAPIQLKSPGLLGFTRDPKGIEGAGYARATAIVQVLQGPALIELQSRGGLLLKARARRQVPAVFCANSSELDELVGLVSPYSADHWVEIPPLSNLIRTDQGLFEAAALSLRVNGSQLLVVGSGDTKHRLLPAFEATGTPASALLLITQAVSDAAGVAPQDRIVAALPLATGVTINLPADIDTSSPLSLRVLTLEAPEGQQVSLQDLFQDRAATPGSDGYPHQDAEVRDARTRLVAISDPIRTKP